MYGYDSLHIPIKQVNNMKEEPHPFPPFVPKNPHFLILGSFPGKESTGEQKNKREDDWYYGAKRNQFWKIISAVYDKELTTKASKQYLFEQLNIAITDIIASCIRSQHNNKDKNLHVTRYNLDAINAILFDESVKEIMFTSIWVKEEFERNIEPSLKRKDIKKTVLPSPSPIYRRLKFEEKVERYKFLLPAFNN